MRDKTRLDDYDNHHRRIGEKDINKEDIKEQEPNDNKKTRPTTSTMTSSIMDHIICAISHFLPSFIVFFASKLDISPFKT